MDSKRISKLKVCIIILNWNGWRDTLECLASLQPLLERRAAAVIVCDNASGDDSFAQILAYARRCFDETQISVIDRPPSDSPEQKSKEDKNPVFRLIQTGANLGFAGGNNVGIRYALAAGNFDYMWLLNNDISVAPTALQALSACASARPEVGIFGSTVLDYYQRDVVQCAGGCRYYPLLTVFRNVLGNKKRHEVMRCGTLSLDYIYGAAMFIKTETFKKAGLLNEEYFLFYEELDFTKRIKAAGYTIAWCKESEVCHKGSASVGSPREGNKEKLKRANYYENLSTLKYTANFHPGILWIAVFLRFALKSLALLVTRRFFLFQPLLRAYRDFFIHRRSRQIKTPADYKND